MPNSIQVIDRYCLKTMSSCASSAAVLAYSKEQLNEDDLFGVYQLRVAIHTADITFITGLQVQKLKKQHFPCTICIQLTQVQCCN